MANTLLRKRDPKKIGYARVSSRNQNLESQIDQLNEAGCYKIFTDTVTGSTMTRKGWQDLIEYLRPDDTIVVTELSRMSRSIADMLSIINSLEEKQVDIISLKENIDTRSAIGRFFFTLMGAMSQMEIELKKECAAAGRFSAKARGRTGGRPRTDPVRLEQAEVLYANSERSALQICQSLGISRRTFFNHLKSRKTENNIV